MEQVPAEEREGMSIEVGQDGYAPDARAIAAEVRRLISSGNPARAFEFVRDGLVHHPEDGELQYLRALALARGGSVANASSALLPCLEDQQLDDALRVEVLSLAGRLAKDRCIHAVTEVEKRAHATESAGHYDAAYAIGGDIYPGINAASMHVRAGNETTGRAIAAEVAAAGQQLIASTSDPDDYWSHATLGEAFLLTGDSDACHEHYGEAVRRAEGFFGDIAAMHRNVSLLAETIDVADDLFALFHQGSVVVFSGHMLDDPDRRALEGTYRFPADPEFEQAVRHELRARLDELDARIGYASIASGSDLIFAEEMLDRGGTLHVVLPFDLEDFLTTSVDFGLDGYLVYRERCSAVLARADVHYATRDAYLGDDTLFDYTNKILQGLGWIQAQSLGMVVTGLVVLDPHSAGKTGGAHSFLERWQTTGNPSNIIDLSLLGQAIAVEASQMDPGDRSHRREVTKIAESRQFRAMLFADVKNFSKLKEEQSPLFFQHFLNLVAQLVAESSTPMLFQNTWGDGLYLVFQEVTDCADFSLRLLEAVRSMNFEDVGLPGELGIRVGLHGGPVYRFLDPIINRENFFGSHVNMAARIEPVTPPGCAYMSEQFASLLALEQSEGLHCEFVGDTELSKGFGRLCLYNLVRR
jgi:class 3 adenylate cyclase